MAAGRPVREHHRVEVVKYGDIVEFKGQLSVKIQ